MQRKAPCESKTYKSGALYLMAPHSHGLNVARKVIHDGAGSRIEGNISGQLSL